MLLTEGIIIVAANLECQPSCITPNEATIYKLHILICIENYPTLIDSNNLGL